MKILSIVGLAIAILGLSAGIYCQVEIVPTYNSFNMTTMSDLEIPLWRSYGDQKFLFGSIALFAGIIAVIIGLITGIKKQKLGWITLVIGAISLIFGLMQSTHMFS